MEWISKELVGLVYALLPGFVAAWIFFGLTAHPRKSPFERVIQALIFTAFVRPFVALIKGVACWIGEEHLKVPFGTWTSGVDFATSVGVGCVLGFLFAICVNLDWPHRLFREWNLTRKTGYPTVWYRAFHSSQRYCILHLAGPNARRLWGWIEEWPDAPRHGHFVIRQPHWVTEEGEMILHSRVEKILIRASEVVMVDWLWDSNEVEEVKADISDQQLRNLHLKDSKGESNE